MIAHETINALISNNNSALKGGRIDTLQTHDAPHAKRQN